MGRIRPGPRAHHTEGETHMETLFDPPPNAYQQGQRDMLAKCIAAVEFLHDHNPDQASAFWYAINELRALQTP